MYEDEVISRELTFKMWYSLKWSVQLDQKCWWMSVLLCLCFSHIVSSRAISVLGNCEVHVYNLRKYHSIQILRHYWFNLLPIGHKHIFIRPSKIWKCFLSKFLEKKMEKYFEISLELRNCKWIMELFFYLAFYETLLYSLTLHSISYGLPNHL